MLHVAAGDVEIDGIKYGCSPRADLTRGDWLCELVLAHKTLVRFILDWAQGITVAAFVALEGVEKVSHQHVNLHHDSPSDNQTRGAAPTITGEEPAAHTHLFTLRPATPPPDLRQRPAAPNWRMHETVLGPTPPEAVSGVVSLDACLLRELADEALDPVVRHRPLRANDAVGSHIGEEEAIGLHLCAAKRQLEVVDPL